jgi:hypothetical protein
MWRFCPHTDPRVRGGSGGAQVQLLRDAHPRGRVRDPAEGADQDAQVRRGRNLADGRDKEVTMITNIST